MDGYDTTAIGASPTFLFTLPLFRHSIQGLSFRSAPLQTELFNLH